MVPASLRVRPVVVVPNSEAERQNSFTGAVVVFVKLVLETGS
jgi:hypothetical protein